MSVIITFTEVTYQLHHACQIQSERLGHTVFIVHLKYFIHHIQVCLQSDRTKVHMSSSSGTLVVTNWRQMAGMLLLYTIEMVS
jgi:hypothetical protein